MDAIYASKEVYHIYNRGYNKQVIFLDQQDYEAYIFRWKAVLGIIPAPLDKSGNKRFTSVPREYFDVLFYALMPNHFHFCIRQNQDKISVSTILQRVNTSYTRYFNAKYERVGHAFQGKPRNKLITDDSYLLVLFAYIHNNPSNPESWGYSSYGHYVSGEHNELISGADIFAGLVGNPSKIKRFIADRRGQSLDLS